MYRFDAEGGKINRYFAGTAFVLSPFYLCILLLRDFGIEDRYISLVLPAILLGTNLFYYPMMEGLMSHHFSFCLITALLLNTRSWLRGNPQSLLWMGICMGLIVLVRPINGVILLLLLFMAESGQAFWNQLKDSLANQKASLMMGIVLSLVIASLQLLIY